MKNKSFILRLKPIFLVLFALLISQMANAQIVAYSLATNADATTGITVNFPGQGRVMNFPGLTSSSYGVTNGQLCLGWDAVLSDSWETSSFSTAAYKTLSVSFQIKTTGTTGPRDFKTQYSVSGGVWTDFGSALTLTTGFQTPNFSLPAACENKSDVKIRWVLTSTTSISGGVISTGAYLKGVSVNGTEFIAPSTQASSISIISVTSNTITVGCSQGNGSKRIIKICNTSTFTNPPNDVSPTANTTYLGTGEQVIYNDVNGTVTVTLPSSNDEVYFRVYEYDTWDGLIRFNNNSASQNPKKCALEYIHTPVSTNIKLLTADMGATVTTPVRDLVDGILDRGIYWDINPNVNEGSNSLSEGGTTGGAFLLNCLVSRGTTIYFKGYVTNGSGTILSAESSFSNIPIFTGSGNWETGANWNVTEVPGTNGSVNGSVNDSPIINGTGACIMTASHNITNLTINSGKSIQINTGTTLNAAGSITNNAGNSGILIKSGDAVANGSLIWNSGSPSGTVEMYSKAYTDGSAYPAKNRWQYFGIPVNSTTVGSTFGGANERVRKYDESNTDVDGVGLWVPADPSHLNTSTLSGATTMVPVDGYEVVQPSAKTYTFTGTLNHSNVSRTLTYSGGPWIGNHILANPFTAAINVSGITYTGDLENAVYIYNTGSRAEWISNNGGSTPGSNPGTYSVSTGGFAGIFGVPAQIPSMQGFLVKATGASNTFGIPLSALTTNNNPQRAPSTSEKVATMIDVIGAHSSDRMWIFSDANCTSKFDNGFDGPKILGSALNTQLFSMGEDGDYQINGVNDINNSYLGFQAGQDTEFKMVFKHQNLASMYTGLYLVDLVANKTIDISADGTEYSFTSEASGTASKRFKIITSTTKVFTADMDSEVKIFGSQNEVFVQNNNANAGNVVLYNMAGIAVRKSILKANGLTTLSNLNAGVYIAKVKTDKEDISKQIIIR